jgi:hypothetical protein
MASARSDRQSQVEQHRRRSRIVVMDTRERERAVATALLLAVGASIDLERVRADVAALTFSDAAQGPRSLTIATRGTCGKHLSRSAHLLREQMT